MVNQVILIGTVKSQPQERGAAISFRMITWRIHHDGRKFDTTHTIEVFGKSKEIASCLHEGQMVSVQGAVKHSSYEKNGQKVWFTSINAFSLTPLDSPAQNVSEQQSYQNRPGSAPQGYPPKNNGDTSTKDKPYEGYDDQYGF